MKIVTLKKNYFVHYVWKKLTSPIRIFSLVLAAIE